MFKIQRETNLQKYKKKFTDPLHEQDVVAQNTRYPGTHVHNSAKYWPICISKGNTANCLSCGGIVNNHFVTNLIPSLLVRKFLKSVNTEQSYGQEYQCIHFWTMV